MQPATSFAALLRQLRTEAGLTQEELAEAASLSPRSVSDLERGINLTARKETARLLADALQLSGTARSRFEAAARGRPVAGGPAVRGGVAAATQTLPRDIASFTGREPELAGLIAARDQVTKPGHDGVVGIFAIGGMAGVGKTAFAVHAAHRLASGYPGGQIFLPLHGHTPGQRPVAPVDALASLLLTSGIPAQQIPPGLEARMNLWRDQLAGQQLLLLLDDAVGTDQVRPLLPGTAGSLVLITSRRHLTSLEDAQAISLDTLPENEAIELLVRLAARPGVEPGDDAVAEICRLCGYLPLAVGMLARQLHHHPAWTPADLAADLRTARDRLELIYTEDLSVAAAFDLSYQDLADGPQRLFRCLGLHPGVDVDAWTAAALAGTDLVTARRNLDAIYDQYLIAEPARGRYALHDLIREHAQAQAAAQPASEHDAALARLTGYYQRTAALAAELFGENPAAAGQAGDRPDLSTRDAAVSWLEAERANLAALIEEAGQRSPATALSLTRTISDFLRRQGHWTQALALHESAIALAEATADRAALAGALVDLAEVEYLSDQYQPALAGLDRALGLYQALGDLRGEASTLASIGNIKRVIGEGETALEPLTRALDLYRTLDDRPGQAQVLLHLGAVQIQIDEYAGAADHLLPALALYRELGNRIGQVNTLNVLGYVRDHNGEYAAAVEVFNEALRLSRELGNRLGEANSLAYLGNAHEHLGDYPAAAAVARAALDIYRELGQRRGQANALYMLGEVQHMAGDQGSAAGTLAEAIDLYREIGGHRDRANALTCLGKVHLQTADYPAAARALQEALGIYREFDDRSGEADALDSLGAVQRASEGRR